MSAQTERKAYKDWFDAEAAVRLGAQVCAVHPTFPEKEFRRRALEGLDALEFHARIEQFSGALRSTLPKDTPAALTILTKSLPPILPDTEAVTDGWLQWPVGHFIGAHGLPHFEESMTAIYELTRRFTSEFAVRPFIAAYPKKTLARLLEWTRDPCPHVRRLSSEGSRPHLPWGANLTSLIADPSPALPILEALKDDPAVYVRRSVSNHLNDIARDHPTITNTSSAPVRLLLDYAVTYVRRVAGTGRKVFKWTTLDLAPGESQTLEKAHPMRRTSTRVLYPGDHDIEVQINGASLARTAFHLH